MTLSSSKRRNYFSLIILVFTLLCGCQQDKLAPTSSPQLHQLQKTATAREKERLTFVVFGDNRPSSPLLSQPQSFKKILSRIKRVRPHIVISTGDSVYGSIDSLTYKKQYLEFVSLIKATKLPFLVTIGNHDAVNKEGIALYQKYLHPQTYFSFKLKNCLFIILDTESQPGKISKEQLNWLEKKLKRNRTSNVFVFLHRPLFSLMNPESNQLKHLSFVDLKNRDQLASLLRKSKVRIVFSGHEHFFNQKTFLGLTQIITGCAGSPPYTDFSHGGFPHFVLVEVKGNDLNIKVFDENGKSYSPKQFKTPTFP